jgi:hypothetical protein
MIICGAHHGIAGGAAIGLKNAWRSLGKGRPSCRPSPRSEALCLPTCQSAPCTMSKAPPRAEVPRRLHGRARTDCPHCAAGICNVDHKGISTVEQVGHPHRCWSAVVSDPVEEIVVRYLATGRERSKFGYHRFHLATKCHFALKQRIPRSSILQGLVWKVNAHRCSPWDRSLPHEFSLLSSFPSICILRQRNPGSLCKSESVMGCGSGYIGYAIISAMIRHDLALMTELPSPHARHATI